MMPLEIAPKIYDVGVVDWAVRDFHGYKTERGASYNSYLIMDEKICLIDTVKAMFAEELLAKIERVVDPGKIDYVIVNHVEPDHAGALPALVKAAPNAKFFITAQGKAEAIRHYGDLYDFQVVKDGDKLSLGKRELTFVTLPMLHWPDSMATYCADDGFCFLMMLLASIMRLLNVLMMKWIWEYFFMRQKNILLIYSGHMRN